MQKESEYISLKEAAQISGYSADYLGQLIRSGRLEGKQVFSNVAWMTTREALEAYALKEKRREKGDLGWGERIYDQLISLEGLTMLSTGILWGFIVLLGAFLLFLAYALAVSVDNYIEQSYIEKGNYERAR